MQFNQEILADIIQELKVVKKESEFPDHVVAQTAVIVSSATDLLKTAQNLKYRSSVVTNTRDHLKSILRKQAIRTIANSIRFIENLK